MNTPNLPAAPETAEITNILNEARKNATFERMLKYEKGQYFCDKKEVPLGTKVIVHCIGWGKEWVKFKDGQFIERRVYRIGKGERIPERQDLDDQDEKFWNIGLDKQPRDPWVFRYLLPVQIVDTDETMIFTAQSFGGRRAVDDLCFTYAQRAARDKNCGQPIVRLESTTMPSKKYGNVQKPKFEIIGWDDGVVPVREMSAEDLKKTDFNDEIPF